MKRLIEQSDLALTYQHVINLSIRVDVYDKDMVFVDSMDCALISGTFNMDANSDVRRTITLVISPTVRHQIGFLIKEESMVWINRNVVLSVGIQNTRTREYTYYKLGTFIIMTYASTYDATTNQLTLNCSDYMALLDGTKNGELSALVTTFPAYKEWRSTEKYGGTDCYYFMDNKVNYSNNIYTIYSPIHTSYTMGDYVIFQIPYRDASDYYYFVPTDAATRRSNFIDTNGKYKDHAFITDNGQAEIQRTEHFDRGPSWNDAEARFRWNNLPALNIYDLNTGKRIKAGMLESGKNYAFRFDSNSLTLISHKPFKTNDEDTIADGTPLQYFRIRDAMITAITRLGGITELKVDDKGEYYGDFNIDDIGEYYGMQQYNDDWMNYRKQNPLWDNIPYDLEFNVGDNVLSIITTLRDLYPNYETYFDEDGVFCCNMVPSDDFDDVYLSNDYLQEILISENYNIDSALVRNVCEVWGASLEVDFTADHCTLNDVTYTINIAEYGETMYTGDRIAIQIENKNPRNAKVKIHTEYTIYQGEETVTKEKTFDAIPIYDEMTDSPLEKDILQPGTMYVFQIKSKILNNNKTSFYLYYQSEYQPQAIDVITDGTVSSETWPCSDGKNVPIWSAEYFADKYGCKIQNVHLTLSSTSPFTVQKIGEVLSVKQGGEFENITSDQRALARAIYENWKAARLTDVITLTTKLCLFLDVNKMVEFQRHDEDSIDNFVITSVSHDFSAGTSSITMTRFRPLYMDDYGFTHDQLSRKKHNTMRRYTHDMLNGGK